MFCLLKLLLIETLSDAAAAVAADVVTVPVVVPFVAVVAGAACPARNVSPPDEARREGFVLVAEMLRCTRL